LECKYPFLKKKRWLELGFETTWSPSLPVCHTYCTQTYVLAAKKSHGTGMKRKQTMSEVKAMHTKNTEKACCEREKHLGLSSTQLYFSN